MPISAEDRSMLLLSQEAQKQSHDPHRQVGVVIADDKNQIISTGTNEPPVSLGFHVDKSHQSIAHDPSWKYYILEHAERNAIFSALKSGTSLAGTTMYGTLFPCADCARAIAAVGITRLVVPSPGIHPVRDQKWMEHYKYADMILRLGGVSVEYFEPTDLVTSEAARPANVATAHGHRS